MRTFLLWLHIVAIAAWLGGNLTQLFIAPILDRVGSRVAEEWYKATVKMGSVYYSVAAVVIIITGIGLVLDQPSYSFSDPFVSIGFTAVFFGAIMGIGFFGPKGRAAAQAHAIGDGGTAAKVRGQLFSGAALDTAVVLFTIWAMVAKVGL